MLELSFRLVPMDYGLFVLVLPDILPFTNVA